MNFFEFKDYLKEHDLTFTLEGWSGCIKDTIYVFRDDEQIFVGPYDRFVEYSDYVAAIESGDPGGDM